MRATGALNLPSPAYRANSPRTWYGGTPPSLRLLRTPSFAAPLKSAIVITRRGSPTTIFTRSGSAPRTALDRFTGAVFAVGYQSESAFSAAFKRTMGTSPRIYARTSAGSGGA